MKDRLIQLIEANTQDSGFPVEPKSAAERLLRFIAEWEKWNARINLTSEKEAALLIDRHIGGSLQYLRGLETPRNILDIGSGGGFPGIPIKAVLPQVPVTLIESHRKRAAFLKQAVRSIGLKEVTVLNVRAEQADAAHRGRYDSVTLRAVGSLADCLRWAAPFLCPGGRMIVQKEPEAGVPETVQSAPGLPALVAEIPLDSPPGPRSKLMVFERRFM